MSGDRILPRANFHLRIFAFAVFVIFSALLSVLFLVRMEAVTHAPGEIACADLIEVRAPRDGIVELGWYDGTIESSQHAHTGIRVDRFSRGVADPASSTGTVDARTAGLPTKKNFHHLQVGDLLWPGQPIASVGIEAQKTDKGMRCLTAPDEGKAWQVVSISANHGQAVDAGDLLMSIVPVDPQTGRAQALIAVLQVPEEEAAHLAKGQPVRLDSKMYSRRVFGRADGVVESIAPMAHKDDEGRRHVETRVRITESPFPLLLGSSVDAEIVLGRKQTYRIILEH